MVSDPSRTHWFRQRTLWFPTWRLWLLLILLIGASGLWVARHLHGWLAVSEPIEDAKYMIVEGWVPDTTVRGALAWAASHDTKLIFTTGIPQERGRLLSQYPTYAEICAETLKSMGADPQKVRPAPVTAVNTERTRAMAIGLKQVLDREHIPAGEHRINLFTSGTHAFRSRMHFQRVLGADWQVGVVSVPTGSYHPEAWWTYSEGVKSVIEELVALAAQALAPSK